MKELWLIYAGSVFLCVLVWAALYVAVGGPLPR
jgi:hypothetical protein